MHKADIKNRQEAEQEFHDRKFGGERKKDYYAAGFTDIIFNAMMSKIGDVEDKKVLEFGCGEGWLTKTLAGRGAEVWAFDISNEAVEMTKKRFDNSTYKYPPHIEQMSAEELRYDADMFDIVIGIAILHHLDLEKSIKGIKRVLKKGGRAYFMEPLGHNPLLNFYRKLTPHLRSPDETPLKFNHLTTIKKTFSNFTHYEYYLTAFLALAWYTLGAKKLTMKTRDSLHKLDQTILRFFPSLKRFCWYTILEIKK